MNHRGVHITVELETAQGWQPIISANSDVLYFRARYGGNKEENVLGDMFEPLKMRFFVKAVELPDDYPDMDSAEDDDAGDSEEL